MNAIEYARVMSADALRRDPTELERQIVGGEPAYAQRIAELEREYFARVTAVRPAALAALRASDPTAAAEGAPDVRRGIGLIGATLAAAGAYAFFFSRATFDFDAVAPIAAGFITAATGFYALAALPVDRRSPPPPNVVVTGWIFVLLTGAAVGIITWGVVRGLAGGFAAGVAACAWIGMVVLVLANARARSGISSEQRRATSARADALREQMRESVLVERDAGVSEVRVAFDALPPARRSALVEQAASASAVLAGRGIPTPASLDPPGVGMILDTIAGAAVGIGVTDVRNAPMDPG